MFIENLYQGVNQNNQMNLLRQYTAGRPTTTISTTQSRHGHQIVLWLLSSPVRLYFTFLYGHTKHNISNRAGGRKENKPTRTWVSSKRKKGEVCDTFVLLSVHLQAIVSVYSIDIPTKQQGTLTHPLTLTKPDLSPQVVAPVLFCRPPGSVNWSILCPGLVCYPWDLPSLVLFRSRGEFRAQALCVGFASIQTKESSEWHLPTPPPRMPNIVSQFAGWSSKKFGCTESVFYSKALIFVIRKNFW